MRKTISILSTSRWILSQFGLTQSPDDDTATVTLFLSRTLGIVTIITSLCFFGLQLTVAFMRFFELADNTLDTRPYENNILTVLEDFQSVFICLRGPVVLFLFFRSRRDFAKVEEMAAAMPSALRHRGSNTTLLIMLGLFLLAWDICFFYQYYPADSVIPVTSTTISQAFYSVHLSMYFWQGAILWLFMCTLPFFLSQAVYVIILLNGRLLADAVAELKDDVSGQLDVERDYYRNSWDAQRLLERYVELVHYSQLLTRTLGPVYLAMYILDTVTMLSFVGVLAGYNISTSITNIMITLLGAAVFAVYIICVGAPFARCYQTSLELEQCVIGLAQHWLPMTRTEMIFEPRSLDPYLSPMMAANLSGLPPALILVSEFDLLRDDGLAYADRLAAEGTPVTVIKSYGFHGVYCFFDQSESGRDMIQSIVDYLKEAV